MGEKMCKEVNLSSRIINSKLYQIIWKSSVNEEQRAEDGKVMGILQFSNSTITMFELIKNYAQNTVLQIMVQVISAVGHRWLWDGVIHI